MPVTKEGNVGGEPVAADMTGPLYATRRIAGLQQHRHRSRSRSAEDVDGQEATLTIPKPGPAGKTLQALSFFATLKTLR